MQAPPATLQLRVTEIHALNPLISMFRLRADDQCTLPAYGAGAHIRVRVDLESGSQDWRHYSLINFRAEPHATETPNDYVIAVRREDEGRGGSRFMHEQVHEGDQLTIQPPKNDFSLHPGPGGTVLVAGGIGVTPLTSMAARRICEGLPVRMHYAGRNRQTMAFLPELNALLGSALNVHADAERGAPLDVSAMLDSCLPDERLYVCGPQFMLDAVLNQARLRGWTPERIHFELFNPPAAEEGDLAFEVELAQSGQRFTVAAKQSILDCLIAHGCDPLFDCKRGECGVCATPVLEGEIDHRDYVLTARERAEGRVMQICVSRAKGARLVLDL